MDRSAARNHRFYFLIPSLMALLYFYYFYHLTDLLASLRPSPPSPDPCAGRYIYVHDLPSRFNSDLIRDCRTISQWTDMCRFFANAGLGPPLHDPTGGVFSGAGWYATDQFTLELIFHNRMKRYKCLTPDPSLAAAVFVPFYAGLDVFRYLWGHNATVRDSTALDLARWLRARPEWTRMSGRDHFLVAGRITWDFRRLTESGDWGNTLLLLPEARNMTALTIEASPWHSNDYAVPYPTYFHPSRKSEIIYWQERMRRSERPWLFSFAGGSRPNATDSIRGVLMEQCRSSRKCYLLECGVGHEKRCHTPAGVMEVFQKSVFCLQPQGDSYTRRSAFDAMVAGCVPVFFHPGSAYVQYMWHLPREYREYSVFVSEEEVREGKVRVEEVLEGIGEEEVSRMREKVVGMIPGLVYRDPRVGEEEMEGVKDAFDVAVEGVIGRVERVRRGEGFGEEEESTWKYELVGRGGKHEWDHFFHRQQQM